MIALNVHEKISLKEKYCMICWLISFLKNTIVGCE